jgi:hypothetical protein
VTGDALQQRERIAHSIGGLRLKHRRVQHWVYARNFLQQNGDCAKAVPKNWRQVRKGLTLLAELEKRSFAGIDSMKFFDKLKQPLSVLNRIRRSAGSWACDRQGHLGDGK